MVAREGRSCHCETFCTDRLTPWGLSELIGLLGIYDENALLLPAFPGNTETDTQIAVPLKKRCA